LEKITEKLRYIWLFTSMFDLLITFGTKPLNAQNHLVSKNTQNLRIPCHGCTSPLEISGLTRFKNYLFILPQKRNYLYLYDLNNLGKTKKLKLIQIPFKYKREPVGSEGWEAIAFREIGTDSLELYFALEKCEGNDFCLFKASAVINPNSKIPINIEPLTPFGSRITAYGNLSFEAISWIDDTILEGVLVIPEKLSNGWLKPLVITESGEHIEVIADSSLYDLRISDMAAHPFQKDAYIACSFCWKGNDKNFMSGNTWCFDSNDKWRSRLSLIVLKIRVNKSGQFVLYSEKRKDLNRKFLKINGPNSQKRHEYNAEGLAVTEKGDFILINDNNPDGAYTELRILSKKYLLEKNH